MTAVANTSREFCLKKNTTLERFIYLTRAMRGRKGETNINTTSPIPLNQPLVSKRPKNSFHARKIIKSNHKIYLVSLNNKSKVKKHLGCHVKGCFVSFSFTKS